MAQFAYVYDKDFSEGLNWGIKCDSESTAKRLLLAIQSDIDVSAYKGCKSNAKLVKGNSFPNAMRRELNDADMIVTSHDMDVIECGTANIEEMLSNKSVNYESKKDKDRDGAARY